MVEPFKVTSAIDRKRDKPLVQHRSRLDLQPMVFIRKRHENIARMHLMRRVVAIGNALAVQNAGKLILIPVKMLRQKQRLVIHRALPGMSHGIAAKIP